MLALKLSQELDELIFEFYSCESAEGKKIVKALIEAKRSELYKTTGELSKKEAQNWKT